MDLDAVHRLLSQSDWARGIPRELVARSLAHSLCFGAFSHGRQIGIARVITSRGPRLLLGEQSGRGKAAKSRGAAGALAIAAARPPAKRRGPQRRAGWAGADWGPRTSRRASGTRGAAALGPAPSNDRAIYA